MKKYTLITGASSGIGREFACYYAQKGRNLILVARRRELLNAIREDLVARYNVDILIFAVDITQLENIRQVVSLIRDNNIYIERFINNAGVCTGGEFAMQDELKIAGILDLNIKALVFFCRHIIPEMKSHGGGQILNLASVAAFEPCPGYALYFASKAFVLSFTESLHSECRPYNIVVSALCPGFVRTEMTKDLPDLPTGIAEPAEIVRLGDRLLNRKKTVGVNGFVNNMLVFLTKIVPRSLLRRIMERLMKYKSKLI